MLVINTFSDFCLFSAPACLWLTSIFARAVVSAGFVYVESYIRD